MNPRITTISLHRLHRIVSANNGVAIVRMNIIDENSDTNIAIYTFWHISVRIVCNLNPRNNFKIFRIQETTGYLLRSFRN